MFKQAFLIGLLLVSAQAQSALSNSPWAEFDVSTEKYCGIIRRTTPIFITTPNRPDGKYIAVRKTEHAFLRIPKKSVTFERRVRCWGEEIHITFDTLDPYETDYTIEVPAGCKVIFTDPNNHTFRLGKNGSTFAIDVHGTAPDLGSPELDEARRAYVSRSPKAPRRAAATAPATPLTVEQNEGPLLFSMQEQREMHAAAVAAATAIASVPRVIQASTDRSSWV